MNEEEELPFMNPYLNNAQETPIESSLRYQLDTDDLILSLRYRLLGFVKRENSVGKTYWEESPNKKAMINEVGMDVLEPLLRGHVDKILPLSDFDREQVENLTLGFEYDVRNLMTINFLEGNSWEIPSLAAASAIKNEMMLLVYATLRKGHLKGYQNFLKTIQRITEVQAYKGNLNQYNEPAQPQRGGGVVNRIRSMFK